MKKTTLYLVLALVFCAFVSQNLFAQASSGIKPELILYRHNSNDFGSSPVVEGDTLGKILFNGLTASKNIRTGASIRSFITGPVSPGFLSSNLVFQTGASTLQNRMVVTAEGLVGIGTMNPEYHLHTVGNTHTSGDFYGRIHMDNNPGDQGPDTYISEAYFENKPSGTLGAPDLNPAGRGGLLTLSPTFNSPTGIDHQLFFNADGIYNRRDAANAANWTATWYKLLTGEDINGTPNRISKFTGPNSLGDSQLFDDGTNVGIGTVTPGAFFDVNGAMKVRGNATFDNNVTVTGNADFGTNVAVAGTLTVQQPAQMNSTATVNGLFSANGGANVLGGLNENGDVNINNGKVAIGTTVSSTNTPGTHLLYVNGSMIATEVKVALQGNWPDYVFETDYQLPDLCETEAFIAAHKHLPGVPSVAEVQQNGGIELGEMNRILLQKIEELTLLLIDQQKQIDALKQGK